MRPGERGSVTVFVVIFTIALVFVAGLVFDGGQILAARRHASNVAESAARAGAQAIDEGELRRSGQIRLDPLSARDRASAYLAAVGHDGSIEITGDTVTVHITIEQELAILGLGGMASVSVDGTGHALLVRGITEELP